MNETSQGSLKEDLMASVFRFRRVGPLVPQEIDGQKTDLSLSEFVLLKRIISTPEGNIETVHDDLYISKPAVCQMLGNLERKGYLNRDVDKTNRRKRILSLTQKGLRAVEVMDKTVHSYFEEIINRFGEKKTRNFISLFNRFADVTEAIRSTGTGNRQ
ncbi:MAG: winged helix DNA-binding protein [Treponema sp.]|jgi:DNA-binding MarR family transcriptional regulator|nr:winged helix DNA-binding protein [Treponema sp.]